MPKPRCDLRYTCPISSWDEGIPLGNGKLGCLIWGPGNVLNFSIDCAGLWDTTSAPGTESPDFTYRNLIDLVYRQSWKKLQNIFDIPYSHPTPTKLAGSYYMDSDRPIAPGYPCKMPARRLLLSVGSWRHICMRNLPWALLLWTEYLRMSKWSFTPPISVLKQMLMVMRIV